MYVCTYSVFERAPRHRSKWISGGREAANEGEANHYWSNSNLDSGDVFLAPHWRIMTAIDHHWLLVFYTHTHRGRVYAANNFTLTSHGFFPGAVSKIVWTETFGLRNTNCCSSKLKTWSFYIHCLKKRDQKPPQASNSDHVCKSLSPFFLGKFPRFMFLPSSIWTPV